MDLNAIKEFQKSLTMISEGAQNIFDEIQEGLTDEQKAEMEKLMHNSKEGKELKKNLDLLKKKKEEMDKSVRAFENYNKK